MKTYDVRQQEWFNDVMMALPDMTENEMLNQRQYFLSMAEESIKMSPSRRGSVEMETNQQTRTRN